MKPTALRRTAYAACLAVFVSACSLAGDITPPPGAQVPAPVSTAIPPSPAAPVAGAGHAFPVSLPSAAEGAALYAEHCTACHGDEGGGDGPMTPQLPKPVPDFTSPALARSAPPRAWFQTITDGRLDSLMPPFAEALTAGERWNVVAYLYTLSTPPEQVEKGKAVYEANCARCHGEAGQGDGPDAGGASLLNLADPSALSILSLDELYTSVTDGVGAAMPAFGSSLTEEERWAAVDYLHTFSYEYAAPGAPQPDRVGAVTGTIVNGTAGASLPPDLPVTLYGFDQAGIATTLTIAANSSGGFRFDDVPYKPGRQFIVTTEYKGMTYHSDVAAFSAGEDALDVPLQVYETTSDPSGLRVDNMHMFMQFEDGQKVTVGQLMLVSNTGDSAYAPENGRTVEFVLPAGASDLNVSEGQEGVNWVRTADGFADTRPVLPGASTFQSLFSYTLPYDRKVKFEQKMLYPVEAVSVLVADPNVKLSGGGLQDQGRQSAQGVEFQTYSRTGIAAGEMFTFQLSGKPGVASSAALTTSNSTSLAVGIGALGGVLLGAGFWWYRRSSATGRGSMSQADLLQAMAALDDAYDDGQVDEHEYRRKRARLKARLLGLYRAGTG